MKIKTSELQGKALDTAVARALGNAPEPWLFKPSTDWAHGGPIIERERINLSQGGGVQAAAFIHAPERPIEWVFGPTPLVAAMRCYVASKLGEEVDIPDELIQERI